MKLVRLSLAAICLLGFSAVAAQATGGPPPAADVPLTVEAPQPSTAVEPLATPAEGCDPTDAILGINPLGAPDADPQTMVCGACSSSNCVGAPRGQACHLGSGLGFGNCNIFSGGYTCSTGGWECQCERGWLD